MRNEIVIYPRAITEIYVRNTPKAFNVGSLGSMHIHHDFEFLLITSGGLKCFAAGEVSFAEEGDIVFVNSRIPHRCEVTKNGTAYITLQFPNPAQGIDSLKYLVRYLTKINYPHHIFKKGDEDTEYLSGKIKEMLEESEHKDRVHDYLMIANKYEITAYLHKNNFIADESNLIDSKSIGAILPIVEYLHENYQNAITLKDISNALHLHGNYICKLFKKTTGVTVVDYLNYIRISKAESMLKEGLSVAEVSEKTGFSSPSYFNKVFKKYFHIAPSTYKKYTT